MSLKKRFHRIIDHRPDWHRIFRNARYAALGLLLFFSAAVLLARNDWLFELLVNFRLFYAMAGFALALLLVRFGPRYLAPVAFGIAVWHGAIWLDPGPSPAEAATCDGTAFTAVSFNLERDNQEKGEVIADLAGFGADLLVLEENTPEWAEYLLELGRFYPYRAPTDWDEDNRAALLSRFPILDWAVIHPVPNGIPSEGISELASEPIAYLTATLLVDDMPVEVMALHAPAPESRTWSVLRDAVLADAAARARTDRPVIIAGDLNVTPWSPTFDDMLAAGGLSNVAAIRRPAPATWPTTLGPLGLPIDHILINDRLSVLAYERGAAIGSDHYPIGARLCLTAPGTDS